MAETTIRPNGNISRTWYPDVADQSDATWGDGAGGSGFGAYMRMGTWTKPADNGVYRTKWRFRYRLSEAGSVTARFLAGYSTGWFLSQQIVITNTAWTWVEYAYIHDPSQAQINDLEVGVEAISGDTFDFQVSEIECDIEYYPPPTTPVVSAPPSTINNTVRPTYTWSTTTPFGQSHYQIKVFTSAQGDPGGATADVYDTTVVSSASSVVPPIDLDNGQTYYAYIRVAHQFGNSSPYWSGWSLVQQFSISIDTGVPTDVIPAEGSTVDTADPIFDAAGSGSAVLRTKRQWQIATDVSFTQNVQLLDEKILRNDHTSAPGIALTAMSGTPLDQTTYYVRCRFVDEDDVVGSWTSVQSFAVDHTPSAAIWKPSGGTTIEYTTSPTVYWYFNDTYPADSQSAYQVEFWKAGDKAGTEIDSGKVTSSSNQAAIGAGIDATWKDVEIRWRVRVWDQDDVQSPWSLEGALYLRDLPTTTITDPTDLGTVDNASPTITWTFSASAGRTQDSYRVRIWDMDFPGTKLVVDSGTVIDQDAVAYSVPTPVLQVSTNYDVQVDLIDSTGLLGADTNSFTAVYTNPTSPVFSVSGVDFASVGEVVIDWSGSTEDANLRGWRVYRRPKTTPESSWELIYDGVTLGDTTTKAFTDYLASAMTNLEYSVTQVVENFSVYVESSYPIEDFYGDAPDYMIVVPSQPSLNMKLYHVVGDSFQDEQEMEVFQLIGRGRRVEYGTRFGQTGSLQASFYDNEEMSARDQRLAMEAIRNSGLEAFLRSPFGDVWNVALMAANVSRIAGVGTQALADITIEYMEITA